MRLARKFARLCYIKGLQCSGAYETPFDSWCEDLQTTCIDCWLDHWPSPGVILWGGLLIVSMRAAVFGEYAISGTSHPSSGNVDVGAWRAPIRTKSIPAGGPPAMAVPPHLNSVAPADFLQNRIGTPADSIWSTFKMPWVMAIELCQSQWSDATGDGRIRKLPTVTI